MKDDFHESWARILSEAPDNFVIQSALATCFERVLEHKHILCSVSGGGDSDVMIDMLIRCGAKEKTDFVFCDTGLEYDATIEHLSELEDKYGIVIHRVSAKKSIPRCAKEYGVPFWSKYASEMIYRLRKHGFQFEDEDFDTLYKKYPKCKSALEWWCNVSEGNTTQFNIKRYPYLREFMIENPPDFPISNLCCAWAKKRALHDMLLCGDYDLQCIGVRQSEGGVRAHMYKNCYTEHEDVDQFRPVFWLRDSDKEEYCSWYGVEHSRCYTEYGLLRTGCFGCPFGKRFEEELEAIKNHEPKLYKAAIAIFGKSYDYTRRYYEYREQRGSTIRRK